MPVERLKDATSGQLRISALTGAGIRTVQQVLDQGARILSLPGVGETTGNRMVGAARTIWQTTVDEMPVRIDIKNRSSAATDLLKAMRAWDAARSIKSATSDLAAADSLRPLLTSLGAQDVTRRRRAREPVRSQTCAPRSPTSSDGPRCSPEAAAPRPAIHGTTSSPAQPTTSRCSPSSASCPMTRRRAKATCPPRSSRQSATSKLETSHLKASLRGYQSFGARFAIVQRKVIIGDEMGLGKTVESLAVLTHLRAKGSHHFLVVCPAAVVTNWVREVAAKSDLRAHRLHGPGRDGALTSWIRNGGVAVTTYDSLGWLEGQIPGPRPARLLGVRRGALHQEPRRPANASIAGPHPSAASEPSCSPERRWRTGSRSSATSSATCAPTSP